MKDKKTYLLWQKARIRSGEHALTPDQAKKLVDLCPHIEEAALLSLTIATGMRRADIVRVKEVEVNFKELEVGYLEKKKGDKIRTVPIPPTTASLIARWLQVKPKSPWLFPAHQKSKGHLSERTAYNILQKNLRILGIEPRPFHALRATCYKIAQSRGWTPEQAAKHIGDTVAVAQEHYGTPSDLEIKQVAREKPLL